MKSGTSRELHVRVEERIRDWRVAVERVLETDSSIIAFGRRDLQPVVVKVIKNPGDEWRSGAILDAFEGKGVVRVYEYVEGAMLLERLSPGVSLVGVALDGRDDQATEILADVIGRISPRPSVDAVPTLQDWAKGFERYASSGDGQIPKHLFERAHRVYSELCASQSQPRLLHGDLHHYNVLLDSERGWLAIDPKGVVGELEYEIGAALRNPYDQLNAFANAAAIERRVERFRQRLGVDVERTLQWGFAQAVLAVLWAVEDGVVIGPDSGWIALANAIQPMITA